MTLAAGAPIPALHLLHARCAHAGASGTFTLEVPALRLDPGQAVAVVGPSGAGKSTLLDLLALALPPIAAATFLVSEADAGALWRQGDDDALTRLRAARIGYVLQQGGLLPFLDVAANIALPQNINRRPDPGRASQLARRLGIDHLLRRAPGTLSVGQRQRVAIARALAHGPALVLADEPTASLHPAMADTVMALLVEQAREGGAALLLATHDPSRAAAHGFALLPLEPASDGTRSVLQPNAT